MLMISFLWHFTSWAENPCGYDVRSSSKLNVDGERNTASCFPKPHWPWMNRQPLHPMSSPLAPRSEYEQRYWYRPSYFSWQHFTSGEYVVCFYRAGLHQRRKHKHKHKKPSCKAPPRCALWLPCKCKPGRRTASSFGHHWCFNTKEAVVMLIACGSHPCAHVCAYSYACVVSLNQLFPTTICTCLQWPDTCFVSQVFLCYSLSEPGSSVDHGCNSHKMRQRMWAVLHNGCGRTGELNRD